MNHDFFLTQHKIFLIRATSFIMFFSLLLGDVTLNPGVIQGSPDKALPSGYHSKKLKILFLTFFTEVETNY